MALTYQDVMTTDLSTLQSASEEWKAMGDKFKTLKTNYDTHVRGALGNGKWVGRATTPQPGVAVSRRTSCGVP